MENFFKELLLTLSDLYKSKMIEEKERAFLKGNGFKWEYNEIDKIISSPQKFEYWKDQIDWNNKGESMRYLVLNMLKDKTDDYENTPEFNNTLKNIEERSISFGELQWLHSFFVYNFTIIYYYLLHI